MLSLAGMCPGQVCRARLKQEGTSEMYSMPRLHPKYNEIRHVGKKTITHLKYSVGDSDLHSWLSASVC